LKKSFGIRFSLQVWFLLAEVGIYIAGMEMPWDAMPWKFLLVIVSRVFNNIVNFNVQELRWNHDGKSLVLMDKEKFTLAFPVQE
jgi:hypothetical protein